MNKQSKFNEYAIPVILIVVLLVAAVVAGFALKTSLVPAGEAACTESAFINGTCSEAGARAVRQQLWFTTLEAQYCSVGCAINDAIVHVTNTPNSTVMNVCISSCAESFINNKRCQWNPNEFNLSQVTWNCLNTTQETQ